MKKLFLKHTVDIKILTGLVTVYLLTRLWNLTKLPLFTDESIYIFWGKFMATDYSNWFISVTDGKPPLLIWMMFPLFHVLPQDAYLIVGRLPSVMAGFASVVGMYFLAKLLFKNVWSGIIAAALYMVTPFFLFHDRLAIYDALLTSTLIWTTYFAIRTAYTLKLRDAILWGISLGFAFLSKATALTFLGLLPVIICILLFKKDLLKSWKKLAMFTVIASVLGYGINSIQRLSNAYYLTERKTAEFQIPLNELLADPLQKTFSNLNAVFGWIIPYVTIPLFVLGVAAFIYLFIKKWRIGLALLILWIIPVIFLATVGRIIFPRYFVFTIPYFLLPISFLIPELMKYKKFKYKWFVLAAFFLILIPALKFDHKLLTDPVNAPFPTTDKYQYIYDHPSGYGLDQVFEYIDGQLDSGKSVTVVTQGTFGLYPYAFNLNYWNTDNIKIMPKFPLDKIDEEMLNAQKNSDVYLIFKEEWEVPEDLPVETVLRVPKPGDKYDIFVTKLKNEEK